MNIFVTGGTGYIGSHTCIELIKSGHQVVIADNLVNSKLEVLSHIETITGVSIPFYEADVTDEAKVRDIFKAHKFDGIIHFAGLKAVGESVAKPLAYYYNNLVSTMVLAKLAAEFEIPKFVFSSSAIRFASLIGIASPIPTNPPLWEIIILLIPITSP